MSLCGNRKTNDNEYMNFVIVIINCTILSLPFSLYFKVSEDQFCFICSGTTDALIQLTEIVLFAGGILIFVSRGRSPQRLRVN